MAAMSVRLKLLACCACGQRKRGVRNVMCLHKKAPIRGTGWGCAACGLPPDGALAIVCDDCIGENWKEGQPLKNEIKYACVGYVEQSTKRIPVDELQGVHEHDPTKHVASFRN